MHFTGAFNRYSHFRPRLVHRGHVGLLAGACSSYFGRDTGWSHPTAVISSFAEDDDFKHERRPNGTPLDLLPQAPGR